MLFFARISLSYLHVQQYQNTVRLRLASCIGEMQPWCRTSGAAQSKADPASWRRHFADVCIHSNVSNTRAPS